MKHKNLMITTIQTGRKIWMMDIATIRMESGARYLAVIMDESTCSVLTPDARLSAKPDFDRHLKQGKSTRWRSVDTASEKFAHAVLR